MENMPEKKKGRIITTMSCEAIRKYIEKKRHQRLEPAERNAVISHCFSCRECLSLYSKVLDEAISKIPKEDVQAWEDYKNSID